MEKALHYIVLLLSTFCTALCQLDNHTHVTCSQDGLHTLNQLIEQTEELQTEKKVRTVKIYNNPSLAVLTLN